MTDVAESTICRNTYAWGLIRSPTMYRYDKTADRVIRFARMASRVVGVSRDLGLLLL